MIAPRVALLNIGVDSLTFPQALSQVWERGGTVVTPNVDHLMKLQHDPDFYRIYQEADFVLCDSKILLWAAKYLGTPLPEQIAGSDFFPAFCAHYGPANAEVKVFLLGGTTDEHVQRATEALNQQADRPIVAGAYSPPFGFLKDEAQIADIIARVQQSGANVLAVGVGAPKQEKFIWAIKDRLPSVRVFLAIGATIDFQSGMTRRAPRWMTQTGLEWAYRMGQEPGRLVRRYLVEDLPIFGLLRRQKQGRYHNPFA